MSKKTRLNKGNILQTGKEFTIETILAAVDVMGQGVVYVSADGMIKSANKSATKILCLPPTEAIGLNLLTPFREIIREDGSTFEFKDHPAMLALHTGETVSNVIMGINHPTRMCWIKVTAQPEFLTGEDKPDQVCLIFNDITDQKQTEHKLDERVKELRAFYALTEIVEAGEITLNDLYQQTINFLPKSWQYPEIACGKITINDQKFNTDHFKETPWKQSAPIWVNGKTVGSIDIFYLAERAKEDEGPFLKEERWLLDSVAERLGRITERKEIAETLQQKNEFIELAIQAARLGKWQQYFYKDQIYLDESARYHFGCNKNVADKEELYGVIHPEDLPRVLKESEITREMGMTDPVATEYRVIHPDGTIKWLSVCSKTKFKKTPSGFVPISAVGTTQDITERKLAEETLQQKTRFLFMLSNCNQALVRITDENELLQEICRICVENGYYRMAWAGYAEHTPEKSIRPVAQFGFEEGYLESARITWDNTKYGKGPTGTAFRTNTPVISQNIRSAPQMAPWHEAAIQRGYASSIALPLNVNGKSIGVFSLYAHDPDAFKPDEVDLLIKLANNLSYGIETIRTRLQQTHLEEELKRSEGRYRLAQRSGHVGSWEWDIQSDTFYWSEEMYILFDKKPGIFIPSNPAIMDCIVAEDREKTTQVLEDAFATGDPFDVEFRILTGNNHVKWINSKGNVIYSDIDEHVIASGTMQDVTHRRQMEEALQRAHQNYKLISENAEDVIWVLDFETQCFTFVSPSVLKLLGYTSDEVLQQPLVKILAPQSLEKAKNYLSQNIQDFLENKPVSSQPIELDQTRKDGSFVSTEVTASLAYDASGKLQVIGISRDITERKKNAELLQKTQSGLELAQSIAHMGSWDLDLAAGTGFWSKEMYQLFNYDPSLGVPSFTEFLKKVHPQDRQTLLKLHNQVIATRESASSIFRAYPQPENEHYYETTIHPGNNPPGQSCCITGTIFDITERHQAQEKLRQSEETNRTILNATLESVFLIDPDGQILLANAECARHYKTTPDEMKGKNIFSFIDAKLAEMEQEIVRSVLTERKSFTFEFELKGTYYLVNLYPIFNHQGEVERIAIYSRDITEGKLAEARLKESEERFRTFIEDAPLAIAITRNELYSYVNKEFLHIFGYASSDEVIGSYFYNIYPEELRDTVRSMNAAWLQGTSAPYKNERICLKKDGTRFDVNVDLDKINLKEGPAIIAFYQDITERKKSEQELIKSKENLEDLVQELTTVQNLLATEKELLSTTLMSIGEVVVVTDAEGFITLFNHAAETITGYSLDEALEKPLNAIFQLCDSSSNEMIQDIIHALLKMDNVQKNGGNYRAPALITRSGKRILISGSISPLLLSQNEIVGYVIVFQDITEKLKFESQTILSQKMAAIGQLAAGIAHEINTPIQYIGDNLKYLEKGFIKRSEMLAVYHLTLTDHLGKPIEQADLDQIEELNNQKKIKRYNEEIPKAIAESLEGVERVRKIVLAMREFSHPSAKEMKPSDINHGIETTITISRNEWKYYAEMQTDLAPNLPLVNCQIDEINQVVLNMIVNAAQAIQEKTGDNPDHKEIIFISTRQDKNQVQIIIRDTGPGIPPKIRERIFDPFFTTKGVGKGTGQGLSLAHNIIVNKHHGKISVDSEPGKGTTFTIQLPIDPAKKE
jgi:two-component system, NtrC family, sensor kinase